MSIPGADAAVARADQEQFIVAGKADALHFFALGRRAEDDLACVRVPEPGLPVLRRREQALAVAAELRVEYPARMRQLVPRRPERPRVPKMRPRIRGAGGQRRATLRR